MIGPSPFRIVADGDPIAGQVVLVRCSHRTLLLSCVAVSTQRGQPPARYIAAEIRSRRGSYGSAIARPTVSASRSAGSSSANLASGSTPRPSRVLLKKQRAAAASTTSRMSASDSPRRRRRSMSWRGDRGGVCRDLVCEVHHRDVDLVEARLVVIGHDLADLVGSEKPVAEHGSMRERAVARAQAPRGGDRGQLVAAEVHVALDRAVELHPGRVYGPDGPRTPRRS